MTLKPIDHEYYVWLMSQVEIPNGKTYFDLFERMHNTEFLPIEIMDENRVADAMDLRREFAGKKALSLEWATFLEILIVLSRALAFTSSYESNPTKWAWRLLKNARLTPAHDPFTDARANRVDDILYSLVWRTYEPNGNGGFFPLNKPKEDQRKVELWYQLNAYLIEKEM